MIAMQPFQTTEYGSKETVAILGVKDTTKPE